jgi:effector-binding domain-containing protein
MADTVQKENQVEVQQLEPQQVVLIRGTVPVAQLGETMGHRTQALSAYLQQSGVRTSGPPFVRYHTFGDTEADFEFGIPVTEPAKGDGPVTSGELPGGAAATTWHIGAHDKLGEAYGRINTWLTEQGRESSGPAVEVYYWLNIVQGIDPSDFADPASWRTQLIQPIK